MCTGDRELLERHLPTAERCLDWIDQYGDRDGDGFQEYANPLVRRATEPGLERSGDALVNPDGTLVKGPKALCELQGYVYDAWQRMAEIHDHLGNGARAGGAAAKAETLFAQFNEAFWDEETGFYAFALDGDKKKGPERRLQSWPLSLVGHCAAGASRPGRLSVHAAGHVQRVGHSHPLGQSSLLQSLFLSKRIRLAAR